MNLIQIRQQFRKLSGRFDLVNSDGSDNGADFFINAGQKYLDRRETNQKSWATKFSKLESGKFAVTIPDCRAIKSVWASNITDGGRTQIFKRDWDVMRNSFESVFPAIDSGAALYYTPLHIRSAPSIDKINAGDMDALCGAAEILVTNDMSYNAIAVLPPTSEDIYVEVVGYYYSNPLVSDEDISYWSQVNPNVLIMGALREVEVFNRNTTGVNDWEAAIASEVVGIAMDLIEEEIAEVSQMEG